MKITSHCESHFDNYEYGTWPFHVASFCCRMFGCFAPATLIKMIQSGLIRPYFCARKVTCSSSFNWEDDTEWLRWRRQHRRQITSSIRVRSDLFMREYAYELWSILWELIVGFQERSIARSSLAILGFVVQPM